MAYKKNSWLTLVLGLLLGVGVAYGAFSYLHRTPPATNNSPFATPPTADVVPPAPVATDENIKEESTYFSIDATYPKSGVGAEDLKSFVISAIELFKKENDVSALSAEEKSDLGFDTGRKYVLTIDYSVKKSAALTTYVVNVYQDTGGAHGNTDTKTFTYEPSGKRILLDDLFKSDGYLPALSSLSATLLETKLKEYADKDMIQAGTAPTPENFSRFYTTDTAIVFLFPPYAVAPYVVGTVELSIPISSLGAIVDGSYFK